ncbi:MAG: DPP IV N-terminal domain-containing protein, partial [Woeseiaceae bacterium]
MQKRIPFVSLVLAIALTTSASAQEERLALEWIFSDEGRTAMAMPRHAWLDSDTLVTYDTRLPKDERTLMTVDADNGRARELVDAKKAVDAMVEILSPEERYEELGWPGAFDSTGRWAVYTKSENIVLLNLRNSEVVAVAVTDAKETSPRFSPDGEWLAFVRDNDIYAYNIESAEETRLTTDGTDTLMNGSVSWVYWEELLNRSDRGFVWSPDSTSIAYLQTDDSGVGEMHYVHYEPNLPRVIKQRHAKPGEANPKVRAGVVDLANASTTWIDLGGNIYEYLPRIKWLADSSRLAVQTMNRPQTVVDIYIADAETGTASHLMRETDPGWVNIHDDLYFLDGNQQFVWRSERDGYSHLYLFNMDGDLVRQITNGAWALRPSGGARNMDQAVSAISDDAIFFTALEKASTERHLYKVGFDGSNLERLSAEDGVHAVWFSPDGRRYVDQHSSIDATPSLRVRNADGSELTVIADAGNTIPDRFDLLEWELFSIAARDGFEMPAMMLKPRFFDPATKYPVVTYVYGGPSAPTVSNAWQGRSRGYYHQLLADSGAIVFLVDNRSAAGKSKIDANTIVEQLYGPVELNDLLDGVAWLKAQPYVDAERVGVWGWSGGGTMTLQSMTSSEEFAAGAAVAPVTDWHYYDTIYTERYMKRPQDNEEGYEATSHAKRAGDLHGRLLLVHGTYDDNVHPQNSWAFSDELIEAGI